MKAQLAVVVHDDDGAARHFAAGAACGGHGNQRGHAVGDLWRAAFNGGVAGERAFMRRGNRHALGAVNRRAAAHRDQAVAAAGLVQRGSGAHGSFGGVGRGLVKHRHRHARQGVQGFLQNAGRLDAGVGHDQRPGDADALAFLPEQLDGAKLELDLGDVVNEGHGLLVFLRCRMKADCRFFLIVPEWAFPDFNS